MSVWEVLGLAPTADARAIKRAYAVLLKKVHPEDDPEGFQRLREAYGEALQLAKTLQAEDAGEAGAAYAEDETRETAGQDESSRDSSKASGESGRLPVWGEANRLARRRSVEGRRSQNGAEARSGSLDRLPARSHSEASGANAAYIGAEAAELIRRIRELYADYGRRIQPEAWEQLLDQERLRSLSFRQAVQSEVLIFLEEHPHLPTAVWQVLDRTFDWTGDELGLVRSVPPEFAAFVLESIRQTAPLRWGDVPVHAGFDQDGFLSLRARGARLLRSGRLREAVGQFDQAYERFSRDPDLLRLRATALHLLGEGLRAEEDWKLLVAHFPGERDALLHLADRMLETSRASEALRLLQYALDLKPNDPQALLGLARCYRELERYAEAQQVCDLALLLEPSDIELRIRLLDLQSLHVQRLLDVLKRYPGDRDTRLAAGELLYELGREKECERVLTEAPIYGLTSEMKALLGRALLKLGREAEAAVRFDEAVEAAETAGQNGYEARLRRGLYLAERGKWNAAEKDLRAAAALVTGENALLWAGLATCSIGLERCGEALEQIGRALRLKPYSAFYETRAVVLHKLRRYEDALEDCGLARAYRSANPRIMVIQAICELRTGRLEQAAESLAFARDLVGDSPEVRAARCELYLRQGKYREVLTEAGPDVTAETTAEARAELLLYRGWAYRKLRFFGEAREAFVQAAKLLPGDLRALRLALDEQFASVIPAERLLAEAERILALDPDDRETRLRWAGLLFERGRFDEAQTALDELSASPTEPSGSALLGYYTGALLLKRSEYAAAVKPLQRAYDGGLRGEAASLLSIALFETGETEQALRLAHEVCAGQPGHSDYAVRLKLMESRSGVPSALRQLMRRDSRPNAWSFAAEPIPVRCDPRGGDFPYEREGATR